MTAIVQPSEQSRLELIFQLFRLHQHDCVELCLFSGSKQEESQSSSIDSQTFTPIFLYVPTFFTLACQTLQAMANDPEFNIRNNIGLRETVFPHVFAKKHCEITLNVFSCVFAWKIK